MKKLLLFFIPVLFSTAGCNQESETMPAVKDIL